MLILVNINQHDQLVFQWMIILFDVKEPKRRPMNLHILLFFPSKVFFMKYQWNTANFMLRINLHDTFYVIDKGSEKPIRACVCASNLLTHLPLCYIHASVKRVGIGSDSGLSPIRHHYLNHCGVIINSTVRTNLSEMLFKIQKYSIH